MRLRSALLVSMCLVAASTTTSVAVAEPAAPHLPNAHASDAARQALQRAEALFQGGQDARRPGATVDRAATLVLRDLAVRADALPAEQRRQAHALLARPTDRRWDDGEVKYHAREHRPLCTDNVCVHWVQRTADAPPLTDRTGNPRIPDWVETTSRTMEHVWTRTVDTDGYRAPKWDGRSKNHGPDKKLDVYLADIGDDFLFGYCTTDDPAIRRRYDVSAYCVLDDDFARRQYGAPPLKSLRATAAHEFFHAVQFAYDITEDVWLMEGTATWREDEVYDGVNDNWRYLGDSPLTRPGVPLDRGDVYGSWVFWRFLSEQLGPGNSDDPTIVRDVWDRADAVKGAPDDYSAQALRRALGARGVAFGEAFADFGALNRVARRVYSEGRHYPQAPVARTHRLSGQRPGTGPQTLRLDHLATQHVVFRLAPGTRGTWRLRVRLDLPNRSRGSAASVMVHRTNGSIRWSHVELDRHGNASASYAFSPRSVSRVALTLSNASIRYRCWQGTRLSCQGAARDDGLRFGYTARANRR